MVVGCWRERHDCDCGVGKRQRLICDLHVQVVSRALGPHCEEARVNGLLGCADDG